MQVARKKNHTGIPETYTEMVDTLNKHCQYDFDLYRYVLTGYEKKIRMNYHTKLKTSKMLSNYSMLTT
jgi:hypothetical protein